MIVYLKVMKCELHDVMLFYVVAHDFNFSLFLIERFSLDLDVMFEDALEM
jgi:hypothetical protein